MPIRSWASAPTDFSTARRALALACVVGCNLIGCNSPSEKAEHEATPRSTGPSATTAATAALATAEAPRSPAAPAPAPSSAPGDVSGSWVGSYDAKKVAIDLPPKVKDKALAADDGKAAAGPGSIELTVLPGGDIRGKMSGALGGGTISGRVDGATLRAAVRPDEPQTANAMTGRLIGERKGEIIACDLRVAGPDATVIRGATFELKRRP